MILLLGILILMISLPVHSQDAVEAASVPSEQNDVFAVILFASGNAVSVFRQGELISYTIGEDDVIGLPLLEGDMVQTEADSFVELQLIPSENIVKVAENTTFELTNIQGEEGGTFELLYGRVRARVAAINQSGSFRIRGRTAVAGVRGTDFGFDYVTRRGEGAVPAASVYCFDGSVEVQSLVNESNSEGGAPDSPGEEGPAAGIAPSTVVISANEMVDVVRKSGSETETPSVRAGALRKRSISPRISEYWQTNDIQSTPVNPDDLEEAFPGIYEMLEDAVSQARLAASLKAFLEAGGTLEEFRASRELDVASPRQKYPLVPSIGVAALVPEIQTEVYKPNALKITGGTMGVIGSLLELSGVVLYFLGEDLGLDPAVGQSYGPVLLASGGVALTVALTSLIIDATR